MLRSERPQKPVKRPKRKPKPRWNDPDTCVVDVMAQRVTLGPKADPICLCGWPFTACDPDKRDREQLRIASKNRGVK